MPAPVAHVITLAAADAGFGAWAQGDPHWRSRLEIAVAIRPTACCRRCSPPPQRRSLRP
jgi:hypothetical protein